MLPGALLFFLCTAMQSFQDYASEKRILELLIKERVKVALKDKLRNVSPATIAGRMASGCLLTTTEQISLLMPPRDTWCRPRRKERLTAQGTKEKSRKQILTRSIALTIKQHRRHPEKHAYLQRLDAFICGLRAMVMSDAPLAFRSIKVVGKTKKVDADGTIILRPLCLFESLTEKLLVALASKYLSEVFDPLLHEEILSYRPLRIYHDSESPVLTDRDNAIANLRDYCARHRRHPLYVAECDIQKYFDTINHDVIRKCFARFAHEVKQQHPTFDYAPVGRIVDAYLDSYSFYTHVAVENERFQQAESLRGDEASNPPRRRYECPKERLFIDRGCYTESELEASRSKIGIPQGGALSGLISNVVLSTIDRASILAAPDAHRFFCRYGDDILLIHPSKDKCLDLINAYCAALSESKLLYHEFVSVSDEPFRHPDGTIRTLLWDQKSRKPFLWGRSADDPESVDWIGFLGYEMRYTGEMRLRRSSLDDKFRGIKRKYRSAAKTRLVRGLDTRLTPSDIEAALLRQVDRFAGDGLSGAKSLTRNRYSLTQALKLNQYASRHLYRLLYKAVRRNHLPPEVLERCWQAAKDKGCFNYRQTLGKR